MDLKLLALISTAAMTAVHLLTRLADADSPQGAAITMQVIMFGNSRMSQAGRDLYITTGE